MGVVRMTQTQSKPAIRRREDVQQVRTAKDLHAGAYCLSIFCTRDEVREAIAGLRHTIELERYQNLEPVTSGHRSNS